MILLIIKNYLNIVYREVKIDCVYALLEATTLHTHHEGAAVICVIEMPGICSPFVQVAWVGFLAMCRSCSSESSLIQRNQVISIVNLSVKNSRKI